MIKDGFPRITAANAIDEDTACFMKIEKFSCGIMSRYRECGESVGEEGRLFVPSFKTEF